MLPILQISADTDIENDYRRNTTKYDESTQKLVRVSFSFFSVTSGLGCLANYRDAKAHTGAYSVIHGGDPACLSILVKDRSELDVPDDKGWRNFIRIFTSLHFKACRHGRIQHIETLLSYDADMDAQNEAGNTPLHVCASYNQTAAARILLFRGANNNRVGNRKGESHNPYYHLNLVSLTEIFGDEQVAIVSNNMDLAENIKNFSEDQVVRIKEEPVFKPRRRRWSGGRAPLNRTSSEPFIAKDLDRLSVKSRTSANSVPYERMDSAGSGGYHSPMGHRKVETTPPNNEYVALQNYHAEGNGELSITKGDVVDDPGMKNGKGTATLKLADTHGAFFEPRVAVLSRGKKGFGFVLRGAKSPKNPSVEFVPTKEFPALQYLESVDRGSPADKAGLLRGDFLLELNGEDVTSAPHQQVVHMVVTAPDTIVMKVVTAPNIRGQEALEKLAAKHPKKLSRFQQRTVSSFESDTWSVCSSLGETDDRDTLIRPEVEIISIGPSTPVMPHNAGATPTGQPQPDDPRNWQSTLPSNGIRSKPQRPTMPPPAPNKFNTVARMTSGQGDNLRHQAIQGASHDRSTAFEVDLADGGISDGVRRYSAGSDSAVSSSRSSPASSYSNTASSTTSGTDSAVNMLYDRTASDSGVPKSHAKKPLPPPPMRSSSLPTDGQSSDGSSQGERVDSPTEPPKTGFAALIAKAAADKNRKSSAGPGEMQALQPASSAGPDHRRSSDMTAFEIAMKAKTKSLGRQSSDDVSPGKSPKAIPEVTDGSSDLMAAIARRKAKVESQHSGSDIESKIKNFKSQEGQDRVMDDAPLASALAKRRSTMEQVSSDESRGVVLAPPALYNDRSLERTQRPSRDHLSETGSVSSSQSSLSTVSNMSTDPSSSNDSSESTDRQDTMDSTNSLKSSSSTSSSVVTVKSNSDPEIISEGNSPDVNGKSDSSRGITSKPAAEWTASEVSEWLSSINMADYINDFVDNEITGEHLMSLTKEDLMELGVKPLGHKKAIMKAIEKLS
ncbi:putative SH3 and multiple ankyrin repeat domains protein 2 isoform X2 [Apostichopus japonicus]|uniref:Putative SH3 and multiple ankyrin repeat domains protein 2 isoform X2 n=1 Tax=Stichopus japonicus TaxID=307972 RepID=A0A2G8KG02_STIJA|nr:putative SH3 and multiple ankyrin repeat domains protein 2 isoform X2 [Apostichopus japonicus]